MTAQCAKCNEVLPAGARFCRQCGALMEENLGSQVDPLLGQVVLDRYRVLRVLGEGGMGRVYLAEQRMGTTTRAVAIKTLRPALTSDAQVVKRFYREAETVVQLTHPNTIQFFDFGELSDGALAIVMEYIEGLSLAEAIRQHGPLDVARVDRVLAQVCGSLCEAHQVGIVHRDLKPENILLTTRGGHDDFVKVLDFGIAKSNEPDDSRTQLTQQGMVVGTPPYMSPEQFSGEPLDARSDVYSLAIVCFEMLSGQLPFQANTAWEWASQHLTAEPRRLPRLEYDQGARRANAIHRALRKSRDERPLDVLAFMREFTGFDDPRMVYSGAGSASSSSSSFVATVAGSLTSASPPNATQEAAHVPKLPTGSAGRWWLSIAAAALGALALAWNFTGGRGGERAEADAPAAASAPALAPAEGTPDPETPVPAAAEPARGNAAAALTDVDPPPDADATRKRSSRSARRAARAMRVDDAPKAAPSRPPATPETDEPELALPPIEAPSSVRAVAEDDGIDATTADSPRETAPIPSSRPEPSTGWPAPGRHTAPAPNPTAASANVAKSAPNPAAQKKAKQIEQLVRGNRVNQALGHFHAAVNEFGAAEPALRRVRADLAASGAREITQLLAQRRCPQAQSLFRALRSADLEAQAEDAFDAASCRKP